MKVDFSQVLRNFEGTAMKEGERELTLAIVAANALLADDPALTSGVLKMERYNLAQRVYDYRNHDRGLDLTLKESALIGDRIAALYSTLVAGQAITMIEAGTRTVLREAPKGDAA